MGLPFEHPFLFLGKGRCPQVPHGNGVQADQEVAGGLGDPQVHPDREGNEEVTTSVPSGR